MVVLLTYNKNENAHRFALSGELLEREKEKEREKEREQQMINKFKSIHTSS